MVVERTQLPDLRLEGGLDLLSLGRRGDLGEAQLTAGQLAVELRDRLLAGAVDEQRRDVVGELVPGRAVHRPVSQSLPLLEDLLHPDVRHTALAESLQVAGGIGEAIDVIDPQAVDEAAGDELQDLAVSLLEDLRVLHAHPCKLVDREEATVPAARAIDVEEPRAALRITPVRVLLAGDHVVGNVIDDHADPRVVRRPGERAEALLAAELP